MKLYELMNEERKKLGPLMTRLSYKIGKKEYVDYYARQGYSLKKEEEVINQSFTALQVDDVYDIFDLLDKVLFNKSMMNQIVYCLYNRTKFIIRFFETLIHGRE